MRRALLAVVPLAGFLAGPAVGYPCPPRPILQVAPGGGAATIWVRDPTQPCAYVGVTVPLAVPPLT